MNPARRKIRLIGIRRSAICCLWGALLTCAAMPNARTILAEETEPETQSIPAQPPGNLVETDPDSENVRSDLDEILSQPAFRRIRHQQAEAEKEYEPLNLDWLATPFRWLWDWLTRGATAASNLGTFWLIGAYGGLAVTCCLIIWLIVRAINSYRIAQAVLVKKSLYSDEGELELPPGDLPADEYRRLATEFADAGHYRDAIGQLILGGMSRTERQGMIRFRRGLTHRDYLRALRGKEPSLGSFRALVGIYEPICFGRRPATHDHYLSAEKSYATGFEDIRPLEVIESR